MKLAPLLLPLVQLGSISTTEAFAPVWRLQTHSTTKIFSQAQADTSTTSETKPKVQPLGLLTFDLDDTLFPIATVVEEANGTYVG